MPLLFHHLRPIATKLFKFCRCPAARPSGRPLFAGDKRMRRAGHAALCKVESGAAPSVALDRVRAPRALPSPLRFRPPSVSLAGRARGPGGRTSRSSAPRDGAGPRSAAATQSSSGLRRRRSAPRLACRF